ncbi:MAG TPA: helix-turn-helix domain-containing protein, partial [Stellaceae bacterium]|nr:helix-turn-helix domain-containing protein [Stellaceae bacterium]
MKTKVERAAVELFAANGFDGVSIADIATAAGVSQGALYRHYPSKEELAWALFSTAYLRTGEELDRIRT